MDGFELTVLSYFERGLRHYIIWCRCILRFYFLVRCTVVLSLSHFKCLAILFQLDSPLMIAILLIKLKHSKKILA